MQFYIYVSSFKHNWTIRTTLLIVNYFYLMIDVLPTITIIKILVSFKSDWVCRLNKNNKNILKILKLKKKFKTLTFIVRNCSSNVLLYMYI